MRNSPVQRIEARCFTIPTETPEADGTFAWSSTTMVLVSTQAAGTKGIGYSYTDCAAAVVIRDVLTPAVEGVDAFDIPRAWDRMVRAVRNIGRAGLCATAISAVDASLWDLKAKLLNVSVVELLGAVREAVPAYGSGGFTSYDEGRLCDQLAGWSGQGFDAVKMKIGSQPAHDLARIESALRAIGRTKLFVDANGAYSRKQALGFAQDLAKLGVAWFEEPVSSDDLDGLRLLRDRGPGGLDIAAGEYGYDVMYFRRMFQAGAVDVLQADATRCLGVSGFLQVGALCEAFGLPLSAHCAPSLHVALGCALPRLRHIEWFHDHARIETALFEGAPKVRDGHLQPDLSRPGFGIELKEADAAAFAKEPS